MLLRGCEKRVVHIKNTESELFEEAYFFLKPEPCRALSVSDLSSAAQKIVETNFLCDTNIPVRPHIKKKGRVLTRILTFACGVLCGGGAVLLFL